jgi:hypothetical protein
MNLQTKLQNFQEKLHSETEAKKSADLAKRVGEYSKRASLLSEYIQHAPGLAAFGFKEADRLALDTIPENLEVAPSVTGFAQVEDVRFTTRLSLVERSYQPVKIEMWAKLGDANKYLDDLSNVTPDQIENYLLQKMTILIQDVRKESERSKNYQAFLQRKREIASEFIDAAKVHDQRWTEWIADHASWMEKEQERIWKPWSAYLVRLAVPTSGGEEDNRQYIESHLTLTPPEEIASSLHEDHIVKLQVIERSGAMVERWISSFLTIEVVHFSAPQREYHIRYTASNYEYDSIYASPVMGVAPSDRPEKPPTWKEELWSTFGESERMGDQVFYDVYQYFNHDGKTSAEVAALDVSKLFPS